MSRLLLRPGDGAQFEAVLKGCINRFDVPQEFSE